MEERFKVIDQRLNSLEKHMAVNEERYKNINTKLDTLTQTNSRLMWTVITALIAAAVSWVVNGGLAT